MAIHCCPECFDDRGLKISIFPALGPTHGNCDFCGSENVDLVEPQQLGIYFELLSNVYEPNPDGKSLVEWMKEDWALFSKPSMDVAHAKELLGEILNNGEIVRKPFIPSKAYTSNGLIQWETFRDEMMYQNRWFLGISIDTERLKPLLELLLADNLPSIWYRARLGSDTTTIPIGDMGAPPPRKTTGGRANPAGIPYLYLGSSPVTAASEVRPHTGDCATVAQFKISSPIRAVDLRNPRKLVSPFLLDDASEIGQLRADIPFLERLGEELTRPVLPSGAAIDYIPSQYLCEFIKKCGHDGVIYRSAVSNGFNMALFDPKKATGISVSQYGIKRVSVDVEPV